VKAKIFAKSEPHQEKCINIYILLGKIQNIMEGSVLSFLKAE
jgi:hypothetical protein